MNTAGNQLNTHHQNGHNAFASNTEIIIKNHAIIARVIFCLVE